LPNMMSDLWYWQINAGQIRLKKIIKTWTWTKWELPQICKSWMILASIA
jgi:hypothetical protein